MLTSPHCCPWHRDLAKPFPYFATRDNPGEDGGKFPPREWGKRSNSIISCALDIAHAVNPFNDCRYQQTVRGRNLGGISLEEIEISKQRRASSIKPS